MSELELTLRQRLVADIGEAGMSRISARRADVAGAGDAAAIEARYLACAGFASLAVDDEAARADAAAANPELALVSGAEPHDDAAWVTTIAAAFADDDPAVRDLALGAARALEHIRDAALSEP